MARPTTKMGRWRHQSRCSARCVIQKRAIASIDSEKVTKTLIEYMMTSAVVEPWV